MHPVPSRHDMLNQCCFNVGPTSRTMAQTLKQHWFNVSCLLGRDFCCIRWTLPDFSSDIVGNPRDREVACSASDRQSSNFESCVWRTVSSQSSHHPQGVLLAQFSLYVHKGGLKSDSFHFICIRWKYTLHAGWSHATPTYFGHKLDARCLKLPNMVSQRKYSRLKCLNVPRIWGK